MDLVVDERRTKGRLLLARLLPRRLCPRTERVKMSSK
jgi:hypothetical protein